MTGKYRNRKIRVLRLLAIVQAYHNYTMMQSYRQLLRHDNSWQDAEHLSLRISMLIPYTKCTPADFLHNHDEITDTVLDHHDNFTKWIKIAETVGITERTLTAFCKNVDNLQSVFRLKALGHIFYSNWLMALYLYLKKDISKAELQHTFVEYSLFSGKTKPANLAEFRKVISEIEKNILQIANKQIYRSIINKLNMGADK